MPLSVWSKTSPIQLNWRPSWALCGVKRVITAALTWRIQFNLSGRSGLARLCELYTYLLHMSIIFTWIQSRACTDEEEAPDTVILKSSPHCYPNDCCYWKLLAAASWPLCWTSVAVPNRSSVAPWSYCIMFLLRCLLPKSHALLAMFVGDDIS